MTKNTPRIEVNTVTFPRCTPDYEEQLNVINAVSRKLAADVYLVVQRSLGHEDGWAYKKVNYINTSQDVCS
ncbi:hypothetical protein P4S64_06175 [Vibrio sp. M60_M31a]